MDLVVVASIKASICEHIEKMRQLSILKKIIAAATRNHNLSIVLMTAIQPNTATAAAADC